MSHEEALAEIERLRGLILAFTKTARLKADADGWCSLVAEFPAFEALRQERDGAASTDPLAALEAAERRLLEVTGWTPGEDDWWHGPYGSRAPRWAVLPMARRAFASKKGP